MTMSETENLRERVAALEADNERKDEEIDRLHKELASERARTTELEETVESQRQTINEQDDRIDQLESRTTQSGETSDTDEFLTPMERVIEAGEAGVLGDVTASVERAMAIAQHFGQWSSRSPNGLLIRDNLRDLLSTAVGERLTWTQVNRACEHLAEYTEGTIAFKNTRKHGNILIAQPDDHRLQSLLAAEG